MISIVMAYTNRLQQLKYTLHSIRFSSCKNFEILIVDDFSSDQHSTDNICVEFSDLPIRIIKMSDIFSAKTYCNPCIVYNTGFKYSTGDKVIIQNPECFHVGDILQFVETSLNDDTYYVFNCYATNKEDSEKIYRGEWISYNPTIPDLTGHSCWYNHSEIRPVMYHFTSAITKKNLLELGGFDESYMYGNGFDDDEFLHRVRMKKLNVCSVSSPMVIHQWHEPAFDHSNNHLVERNWRLFNDITLNLKN
jgi:glycosyltransferase involved in cell wall biosynthesis